MADNVDPEDPRPSGHYHVGRDAEWFFADDDLAETIALGPATDGEPGDDWVFTLSAAMSERDPAAAERVAVRLTHPAATSHGEVSYSHVASAAPLAR